LFARVRVEIGGDGYGGPRSGLLLDPHRVPRTNESENNAVVTGDCGGLVLGKSSGCAAPKPSADDPHLSPVPFPAPSCRGQARAAAVWTRGFFFSMVGRGGLECSGVQV
jgi:hypothetical protein